MPKLLRAFTMVLLPIITLLLGWQLGASYEQKRLNNMTEHLEFLYTGGAGSGQSIQSEDDAIEFALLQGMWKLMKEHYIAPEELKPQEMLFGAAAGFTNAIGDRYTTFMTPKTNQNFYQSLQGKLEGIGAELTLTDGKIMVVAPLKGSPAIRAGLLPEDVIVGVDGTDIRGQTLSQAVQLIRGPRGTTVTLTIEREGEPEPLEISIVRAEITVPSAEGEVKETASGSVAYIEINQFGEPTTREVESILKDLLQEDVKGLIVDVRFNGGGYLERAVELVSLFLQQGKVVSVSRRDVEPTHHYVNGRPLNTDMPMVVLINEGSASASEILAGALQDHDRATVVGKMSFGKGTIQEIYELPGGSSLRITTARWLTPNGTDLGKEGITPDIDVERTIEQMQAQEDPQLDAAIEWLVDGERPPQVTPIAEADATSEEGVEE